MTIGELQQSKIIDENEFVCILKGDVNNPCRVYKGRFFGVPEQLFDKEIQNEGVGAMRNRRRESLYLESHQWLEIWIED